MLRTLYLVDIEAVETRYTAQWQKFVPEQISRHGFDVHVIGNNTVPQVTTPGAFLNFAGTNTYKSEQLIEIATLFTANKIKPNDYFLFTDAWNPCVIQLKYMSELLNIPVRIGGLWHAGSYDPQDFLGRLIGDKPWVRNAEASMFHCYDDNFFATRFHANMFLKELLGVEPLFTEDAVEEWQQDIEVYGGGQPKVHIVGWPMEYLHDTLQPYQTIQKKNKILFPHRLAPEKQLNIFKDLAKEMPEYNWVVAQENDFTKDDYHRCLAESMIVFSANLQETLGISMYEGAKLGAFALIPDRLSYSEMWNDMFKYPSEWTENWDSYQKNKPLLINKIRNIMGSNNRDLPNSVRNVIINTTDNFFNGNKLYNTILDSKI